MAHCPIIMREHVRRLQVDKGVKVFSIGDEFLMHVFKAQLAASICSILNVTSTEDQISHESSLEWLRSTAETIVAKSVFPLTSSSDPRYADHRAFLHLAFLYVDLREAIRYKDGPQIIRHWKLWLPRFIGTARKNYATEAVHLLANVFGDLPKHLGYIAIHNRTVNMEGKLGHGKPIDQMVEHYNL